MKAQCTKCGSKSTKLCLDGPQDPAGRNWYRCLHCGKDFVVESKKENA